MWLGMEALPGMGWDSQIVPPVSARWHHARAAAQSLGRRADITKLINAFFPSFLFFFFLPLETYLGRE